MRIFLALLLPCCAARTTGNWTRVVLTDAAAKGAVCIDGSPGVYYVRTSNNAGTAPADPSKWVVYMEGGGWTSSDSSSVGRSLTDLGSSRGYPLLFPGAEGGAMFGTPPFDDATIVYNKYCDGGSWMGALSNPPRSVLNKTSGANVTLYYRGRGLFDAIFDDLFAHRALGAAAQLTFAGCSAGGLTTYVHADAVAAKMAARAPAAKVVAVADAMFSLDHDNVAADGHWPRFMQWVYANMDPRGASVNDACVTAMANEFGVPRGNRSEGWRCMFGSAVAKYVETPTFVLNSKYDHWQGAQIIGAGKCAANITGCPADVQAFWVDYGHSMLALLDAMPARHGAYIHNCQSHCQTGFGAGYNSDTVNGTVMGDAVAQWHAAAMAGTQESVPRHVDRCDLVPCANDICKGVPTPAL